MMLKIEQLVEGRGGSDFVSLTPLQRQDILSLAIRNCPLKTDY